MSDDCAHCGGYAGAAFWIPVEVSRYAKSRGYGRPWYICETCRANGVSLFYKEDESEFVYYCGLPTPGYTNACPRHE